MGAKGSSEADQIMKKNANNSVNEAIPVDDLRSADEAAAELDALLLQRFPQQKQTKKSRARRTKTQKPDVSLLLQALADEAGQTTEDAPEGVRAAPDAADTSEHASRRKSAAGRERRGRRIVVDILFYCILALVLFGAYFFSVSQDPNKSVLGYRIYSIQTSSMADVYPPGSLILVKMRGEGTVIQVGDDITFYESPKAVVTHRVTEILHNYGDTGMTAYRTKGVNNQTEDAEPALEPNVVGKVVFSVNGLGAFLQWAMERRWLVIALVALPFIIFALLRYGLRASTSE